MSGMDETGPVLTLDEVLTQADDAIRQKISEAVGAGRNAAHLRELVDVLAHIEAAYSADQMATRPSHPPTVTTRP